MTGIYLLFAAAIWVVFVIWLSKIVTGKLSKATWRIPIAVVIFAALLPLPLIDDIVGGKQFLELCKQYDAVQVDRERARGRTVYLLDQPDRWIEGLAVPIRSQKWTFVDVATHETVIEWHELYALGGYLIRSLKISEGNVPLTFKGSCAPGGGVNSIQLLKKLGVIQVQRSTIDKAEKK